MKLCELTFANRDEVIDILRTRKTIWGEVDWKKDESLFRRRSTYAGNFWFGLYEDGQLDCWFYNNPFEYCGDKTYSQAMVCSRKKSNRIKLANGFDKNVTILYNYNYLKMRAKGYSFYFGAASQNYKPFFTNEFSFHHDMQLTVIEEILPGKKTADPILSKNVFCGPSTATVYIRKFEPVL
jgi:hypothetical protein